MGDSNYSTQLMLVCPGSESVGNGYTKKGVPGQYYRLSEEKKPRELFTGKGLAEGGLLSGFRTLLG